MPNGDELPGNILEAHDQGRSETRKTLAAGEMSDAYAYKLTKGSFGLAFWMGLGVGAWLMFGLHWRFWSAALTALVAWPLLGMALALVQTGLIMLIWRSRRVAANNSN